MSTIVTKEDDGAHPHSNSLLGEVRVARAHVLVLDVLPAPVDVVPVRGLVVRLLIGGGGIDSVGARPCASVAVWPATSKARKRHQEGIRVH